MDTITVVGGGIAGLTAAIAGAEQGAACAVREAHQRARRPRPQPRRPLQGQPRTPRTAGRSPFWNGLASATCCPRWTRGRRLSGVRFRWRDDIRRVPAVGAAVAALAAPRPRSARGARLPHLGRRSRRRRGGGRPGAQRRHPHLLPRPRRAVRGVPVGAPRAGLLSAPPEAGSRSAVGRRSSTACASARSSSACRSRPATACTSCPTGP